MSKIIPANVKEEMVAFYKSRPMTYNEVAKKYHYSFPTIVKVFKEYHCQNLYTKTKLFNPYLKENFFENITTEEQAYFLGLIITDGNIYTKKNKHIVSLCFDKKDAYILHKFRKILKLNKKVTGDGRGCKQIQVHSQKMVDDLNRLGIKDNKTYTSHLLKLPEELMPHLIRGLLDGDGSIYACKSSKRNCTIAFTGCGNIVYEIKEYLIKKLDLSDRKIDEYSSCKIIRWSSQDDLKKLYHYLYDDATIFFTRKKKIITEYLANLGK